MSFDKDKNIVVPERVVEQLWQSAGVSTYHPDGDQAEKLHAFAKSLIEEFGFRLPSTADIRRQLTEAQARLAELEGQEPVAWNQRWPVMGYGKVAIGGGQAPDRGMLYLLYMEMDEARPIGTDTTDLFPVGSAADPAKTLACIYFKDGAAMQQTIDVLREMQEEIGYSATSPADQKDAVRVQVTLTGKEIRELAEFAGFSIVENDYTDENETEMVVETCPESGILNDDNRAEHYRLIAYLAEYPEEGCLPLGDRIDAAMLAASPVDPCHAGQSCKYQTEDGCGLLDKCAFEPAPPDSPAHRAAKVLMEALEFYARMDHVEYLSGKRDWEADRKSLAKRGFRFVHEDTDGQETFVEYGEKAEEAIATARQIMEGGE